LGVIAGRSAAGARRAGRVVVTLPAELDVANARQVQASLMATIESGARLVIAEMSGTTFCDVRGARAIIGAAEAAAAAGVMLHVEGAGRLPLKVLTLLGARGLAGSPGPRPVPVRGSREPR
jgi:anti-sigma B factor antagonist